MDVTVQMRSLVRAETMIGGLKPRQVFWCTEAQAVHFIEHRIAEFIAPLRAPAETQQMAPQEVKKSLPEEPAGQLTASAVSKETGKDAPSFVSQPVQASTPAKRNSIFSALIKPQRT